MKSIKDKVVALRKMMKKENISAYIIPTTGPHMSEYVADHWAHRQWVSGFTGSAGTVVVTLKKAGLWTDVRYFQQAEVELNETGIDLFRMGSPKVPSISAWLGRELKKESRVSAASVTTMIATEQSYKSSLNKFNLKFVTSDDLVGKIWADRPKLSRDKIFEHDSKYAGASRWAKLKKVRKQLKRQKADALLVTSLDDIGWVLNLRGRDVSFNPVFYAYLWVEKEKSVLFIDEKKVPIDLVINLAKKGIEIRSYTKIFAQLEILSKGKRVAVDINVTNCQLGKYLKPKRQVDVKGMIMNMKAIKNEVEMRHLKNVMIKDGVALIKAFRWLENTLNTGTTNEYEFGEKIEEFRSQQAGYFGESFNPIVGYQSNGAIMHYRAHKEECKTIRNQGVLLVDSGGQYVDGTTDITRTIAMGDVTQAQKKHYTLVLKGHIALAKIHFPAGTTGIQLDVLTRQYLWNHNLDFGHGTGHGVGFFMNVHEPPQGFAPKFNDRGTTVHQPGMYTSNEPGYYLEGSHGIRLENLVLCVDTNDESGFLRHESITLFPFDLNFIDRSLMTDGEVAWLNSYHRKVEKKLAPNLSIDEKSWLADRCVAIH